MCTPPTASTANEHYTCHTFTKVWIAVIASVSELLSFIIPHGRTVDSCKQTHIAQYLVLSKALPKKNISRWWANGGNSSEGNAIFKIVFARFNLIKFYPIAVFYLFIIFSVASLCPTHYYRSIDVSFSYRKVFVLRYEWKRKEKNCIDLGGVRARETEASAVPTERQSITKKSISNAQRNDIEHRIVSNGNNIHCAHAHIHTGHTLHRCFRARLYKNGESACRTTHICNNCLIFIRFGLKKNTKTYIYHRKWDTAHMYALRGTCDT